MENKIILLVEDNPDDVLLTMRALKKANIANEVVVARDGVEALDYFKGAGVFAGRGAVIMPEVALLDLKLPRISGMEVLKHLRANNQTKLLPIVVLTSSKEDRDLIASYELGANSFVSKPVDFLRFAEAVQQLGLYWLILNRPPPLDH
jgi:two-component system response regulator